MRKLSAYFLAIIIAAQGFYNLGVVGYWLANRAYIAANLCENRDRPDEHCDGKCYLKKKIAAAPDAPANDASPLPMLKKCSDLSEFLPSAPMSICAHFPLEKAILMPTQHPLRGILPENGVFHPPPVG